MLSCCCSSQLGYLFLLDCAALQVFNEHFNFVRPPAVCNSRLLLATLRQSLVVVADATAGCGLEAGQI